MKRRTRNTEILDRRSGICCRSVTHGRPIAEAKHRTGKEGNLEQPLPPPTAGCLSMLIRVGCRPRGPCAIWRVWTRRWPRRCLTCDGSNWDRRRGGPMRMQRRNGGESANERPSGRPSSSLTMHTRRRRRRRPPQRIKQIAETEEGTNAITNGNPSYGIKNIPRGKETGVTDSDCVNANYRHTWLKQTHRVTTITSIQ